MINNFKEWRKPTGNVTVSYTDLITFEPNELGQWITVSGGVRTDGSYSFAVLFMAPPGAEEAFDLLVEYPATDSGWEMARTIGRVADRVLICAGNLRTAEEGA